MFAELISPEQLVILTQIIFIDLVYYIDINDFNGRREVQLKLIDLKTAKNIN